MVRGSAPTLVVLLIGVPLAAGDPDVGPTGRTGVNAALMAFGGLALAFRDRAPRAVFLAALPAGQLPLAVALHTAAARRLRTSTLLTMAVTSAVRLTIPFSFSDLADWSGRAALAEDPIVFGALPLLLGVTAALRSSQIDALSEQARRLEAEQTLARERAATVERSRLAREIHDVVSNRVALIALHAGACLHSGVDDPSTVRTELEIIRGLGDQALGELRSMLGVLPVDAVEPPSLKGLSHLVEQSRAAGMDVLLTVTGPLEPADSAVEHAAYRIVQEALTNAHKHTRDARVHVTVTPALDHLELLISNTAGSPDAVAPSAGGRGIAGMRRRVEELAGEFSAGPTDEGGFAVRAILPGTARNQ
ncbi:histidine kinase [Streptomyces sp. NPDC046881]|uniref:sensor histidine kinase n=1 Tax=Streptomyces sp. NPDC046881 TaxID=3155374 RepID=UPI0033E32EE6